MNKRMRELLAQIEAKTAEAKSFMDGEEKDVEKASYLMDEVDRLKTEYETEKRIYEASKANDPVGKAFEDPAANATPEKTAAEKFADAVKSIITKGAVPSESVGADGGYTVPEDIQTDINKWAEVDYSLLNDIDVVNVTTNKGARTYQKKGDADVFTDLDENGAITGQLAPPNFERVTYTIQDRAGFMPVSNDLISDSTANIVQVVTDWIGKSNVATSNAKILAIVKKKTQLNFCGIKGIKKAVNVTLGQAYKNGTKIYTNDDGLNFLDTLDDANGRPLLNPDPTSPAQLQLRCGTVVAPIRVIPNGIFASEKNYELTADTDIVSGKTYYTRSGSEGAYTYTEVSSPAKASLGTYYECETRTPFIIGDLKSGIRKWDRQSVSIMASSVASIGSFNAFEKNMTLMRAILRDDYTELDSDAYVYGYIDTSSEKN